MPRKSLASKAEGIAYDQYAILCRYALAKARRYNLPEVGVSDVMLQRLSEPQLQTLSGLVAAAGFHLKVRHHRSYISEIPAITRRRSVPRFGASYEGDDRVRESRRTDKHNYYE